MGFREIKAKIPKQCQCTQIQYTPLFVQHFPYNHCHLRHTCMVIKTMGKKVTNRLLSSETLERTFLGNLNLMKIKITHYCEVVPHGKRHTAPHHDQHCKQTDGSPCSPPYTTLLVHLKLLAVTMADGVNHAIKWKIDLLCF